MSERARWRAVVSSFDLDRMLEIHYLALRGDPVPDAETAWLVYWYAREQMRRWEDYLLLLVPLAVWVRTRRLRPTLITALLVSPLPLMNADLQLRNWPRAIRINGYLARQHATDVGGPVAP